MTTSVSTVIPEITIHDNRAVTTSIAVANYFEKSHDNVLKKIRAVIADCPPSYHVVNFNEMVRSVPGGDGAMRQMPMFELTRDAFVLIVMGFTGKKALQWKIDYINAFNAMEAELLQCSTLPVPAYPPFSDDYANRTELIYYHDYKPIFCRVLKSEEIVMSHEAMKEWLELQGLVFFTREELETLSLPQLLKRIGKYVRAV
ncbi:Rha family transcriptional regulator [Enterobacter ludwigii]